jgi:glutamate synthase domain-containing protein 3
MAIKIGNMRASGLIAGVIVVVLGALMMAEGVVVIAGNASFMFAENMNRGFEFVVGFVAIVLGAVVMDLSRS